MFSCIYNEWYNMNRAVDMKGSAHSVVSLLLKWSRRLVDTLTLICSVIRERTLQTLFCFTASLYWGYVVFHVPLGKEDFPWWWTSLHAVWWGPWMVEISCPSLVHSRKNFWCLNLDWELWGLLILVLFLFDNYLLYVVSLYHSPY